ncbi:unnamed protein product [Closterium sp. Yama58-4]|nr:unnamed protein product [Closterium sp. Yama58-4]
MRNGRVWVTSARRIRFSSGRTGGWESAWRSSSPTSPSPSPSTSPCMPSCCRRLSQGIVVRHNRSLRGTDSSAARSGAGHGDGASSGEAFPGMDDWPDAPSLPRRRILRAASSDDLVDVDDLDMVHNQNMPLPDWARDIPSMTIFCAPKPYLNTPEDPQRRALLSWLRLRPQPKVVLLGSDPSFDLLAQEFPGSVFVDSTIDTNFYGVPLFHAMVARAQAADTPLSMLINGDIILLSDIVPAIGRVQAFFSEWILTASRWDVAVDFPYSFEKDAWRRKPGPVGMMAEAQREAEIRRFVRREGSLHTYGGVDLWVWNNVPNVPLFSAHMPPFSFGRGKYDNWFVHEAVASGLRQVVDASDAITSIHVAHTYSHVRVEESKAGGHFWSTRKKSSWELFANIHLAETHGTYTNQKGTALHTPWRLSSCYEPDSLNICMLKRERPANCSCEYSAYEYKTQSDPRKHHSGDFWVCGVVSIDRRADFAINAVARTNSTVGLPHTMEQLLPQLARIVPDVPLPGAAGAGKPKELKVVTLVAVTFGYAEMLMNFVCNLRKLGLGNNLVVAALDEDLYRFAFTQGLAVFYERASTTMRGIDQGQCQFGTKCFRQFTKLKSRAVLRVLKAGYSVLWSDVDIVWFSDPLPHLLSYGPGTFPIQSNEPNATLSGTGIRRINSGFYFARADPMTVKGFEAIVAHAAKTQLSEQPSFYDVLCGEKGELLLPESVVDADGRKVHREECQWSNGLRTIFLPRDMYPNGAVHDFWNQPNVANACSGCTILHNNWISGKEAKKDRLVKNRFWFYDSSRRMCIHDWHAMLRERFGDEMGVGKSTDAASATEASTAPANAEEEASVDVEKIREQLLREGFVILKDALPQSTEWSELPKLPAQLFPTTASESESESDAELISTPASLVAKALLPSLPASALRVVEDVTGTNVDQGPATWHTVIRQWSAGLGCLDGKTCEDPSFVSDNWQVACTPPDDVELSRQRLDDAILTVVVATQNASDTSASSQLAIFPHSHWLVADWLDAADKEPSLNLFPRPNQLPLPAPIKEEGADVAPGTFSLPPELSEQELEALEEEEEKANLGNWAVAMVGRSSPSAEAAEAAAVSFPHADARSLMLWRLTSQTRHLLEAQRFEEALPLLRRAVGLRPQDAWLWYQAGRSGEQAAPKGQLAGRAGRKCMLEDSERFLLRAMELAPAWPLPYASLINALIAMGRGRENEAPAVLQQLLAIPRLAAICAANPATAATINSAVQSVVISLASHAQNEEARRIQKLAQATIHAVLSFPFGMRVKGVPVSFLFQEAQFQETVQPFSSSAPLPALPCSLPARIYAPSEHLRFFRVVRTLQHASSTSLNLETKPAPAFVKSGVRTGVRAEAKPTAEATLTGVVFEPFAEVQSQLTQVPAVIQPQESFARQNYSSAAEAGINEQINIEYNISYVYHALYAYFDRDNVALPGFAKYFKAASEEEREHAEKLMEYQNKRGGRVKLQSILMPATMEFDHPEKGDALYAMELTLALEKLVNEKLLALHKVAADAGDVQLTDFLEGNFLNEQVDAIKKVSDYVSQLRRVGKGHGVYHFDLQLEAGAH